MDIEGITTSQNIMSVNKFHPISIENGTKVIANPTVTAKVPFNLFFVSFFISILKLPLSNRNVFAQVLSSINLAWSANRFFVLT